MKTTICDITGKCPGRLIAVSDIHGHGHYLKGLLEQLCFSEQDALVIVGDLIEKGGNSLETIRYVMRLKESNPHVFLTAGNVDCSRMGNFFDKSEGNGRRFLEELRWTERVWGCGLFPEILAELGIKTEELDESSVAAVKEAISEKYRRELEFIWNLPTIITYGDYIFVHAGVPTDQVETLLEEDAFRFMKIDAFLEQKNVFERCVVVGHWPASLYYRDAECMNPVFDYERQTIAIDGGCALKKGGQLNAIVIPEQHAAMRRITWSSYDDYPAVYAKTAQEANKGTVYIKYPNMEVELVSETEDTAELRQKSSGILFHVPKRYLYRRGEKLYCEDYTDEELKIQAGEALKLIGQTSAGAFVKQDGKLGWYRGELCRRNS